MRDAKCELYYDLNINEQLVNAGKIHKYCKAYLPFILSSIAIGLNIGFIGEPAQDAGGPLREYFRLLWIALGQKCSLFTGKENARVLAHNVTAIQQRAYVIVGH